MSVLRAEARFVIGGYGRLLSAAPSLLRARLRPRRFLGVDSYCLLSFSVEVIFVFSAMVLRELCVFVLVAVAHWASLSAAFSQSMDSDFTFTLPAGRKECFFQTMKKDASLEIEYQVRLTKRLPRLCVSEQSV